MSSRPPFQDPPNAFWERARDAFSKLDAIDAEALQVQLGIVRPLLLEGRIAEAQQLIFKVLDDSAALMADSEVALAGATRLLERYTAGTDRGGRRTATSGLNWDTRDTSFSLAPLVLSLVTKIRLPQGLSAEEVRAFHVSLFIFIVLSVFAIGQGMNSRSAAEAVNRDISALFLARGADAAPTLTASRNVVLRSLPDGQSPRVARFSGGTQFRRLTDMQGWVYVEEPVTGKTGWVPRRYLRGLR